MKKNNTGMLEGPLFPSIIKYVVPLMLSSILQILFNAADQVVVGRFCGSDAFASVGATSSLVNLIVNLFIGISTGAGIVVAKAYGARDDKTVHNAVHTAIPLAVISGTILTLIGLFFSKKLLVFMDTPADILPYSTKYLKIYFCGSIFSLLYNFAAAILRAVGDTKSPFISLSIAGIVNVVLNIVLVTLFNMDVDGVAIATVISHVISSILVIYSLCNREDSARLMFGKLKIYKDSVLNILKIGIPSGLNSCMFSMSNVLIQSSINSFGKAVVAGDSAARSVEHFTYVVMNSFYQASLNFTGQNLGAKQYKRLFKAVGVCLLSVMIIGLTMSVVIYTFGESLLSIFITDSPDAIRYGMIKLAFVGLPYFLCGMMEVSTGAIRGFGAAIVPMIISVIGVCGIRIGWILTIFKIPKFHTLESLYFSYPVSWILTFIAQMIALYFVYKNYRKKNQDI
ncbi:MAG: MATE family efflux transporter [Ruminococcaceae bacterium]|nr:MATE family efflux transporter [Oscillospiraceae bacterium]